jgi:xanthine dehydrogenase accessory factor
MEAIGAARPVVLATVIDTSRSVPRHAGSKMLVFGDGSTVGTVGGGEMESRVIEQALAALTDGQTRSLEFSLLDPRKGDPGVCGGEVRLYLEPYMPAPVVYVVGCGHIGKAIVELAHWLGYRVVASDDRPEMVSEEALPLADIRISGPITEVLERVPVTEDTHVVVVNRNMVVDLEVLPHLLKSPARSIGLMGSKRRWDTTRKELLARGCSEADLGRLRAPIGLELGAETPEEIAVSVLAELVMLRRTATGEPMSS